MWCRHGLDDERPVSDAWNSQKISVVSFCSHATAIQRHHVWHACAIATGAQDLSNVKRLLHRDARVSKIAFHARVSFITSSVSFQNRRRRSRSRAPRNQRSIDDEVLDDRMKSPHESRTMLMTNSEAIHNLYGEISTERDGDLTHQCIQTNLADVICGGNPNDKIIYPRSAKRRSASFPTPRSLERRHSLRLFGSTKRLQRCQSTKSLTKNTTLRPNQSNIVTDSSSSEYQSTDSSSPSEYFKNFK